MTPSPLREHDTITAIYNTMDYEKIKGQNKKEGAENDHSLKGEG